MFPDPFLPRVAVMVGKGSGYARLTNHQVIHYTPNFQLSTPNTAPLVPLACQLTHLQSIAPSTPQQSPPVLSKLVGYTPTSYSAHVPLKTGRTTHTQPISSSVAQLYLVFVLCLVGKKKRGLNIWEEGRSHTLLRMRMCEFLKRGGPPPFHSSLLLL